MGIWTTDDADVDPIIPDQTVEVVPAVVHTVDDEDVPLDPHAGTGAFIDILEPLEA